MKIRLSVAGLVLATLGSTQVDAQAMSLVCQFTGGPKAGMTQNFAGFPNVSPAPVGGSCTDGAGSWGVAAPLSSFCFFNGGPRMGQVQNYAPQPPLPMGTPCQDGMGSVGVVR